MCLGMVAGHDLNQGLLLIDMLTLSFSGWVRLGNNVLKIYTLAKRLKRLDEKKFC